MEKYDKTICACFVGYIVQAIVNNFVPLLFITFEKSYGIPLKQITMLITVKAYCVFSLIYASACPRRLFCLWQAVL